MKKVILVNNSTGRKKKKEKEKKWDQLHLQIVSCWFDMLGLTSGETFSLITENWD